MKKILLSFFAIGLLVPAIGFGQILDSLKIEYSNPGINNNVEVIAFLTIGSSPAWRISNTSTISNDTLYMSSCYYSGALLAMSYLSDTIQLGAIPPNVRGLHFRIYRANTPNTCDTSLYIKNIFAFKIQNPTGISNIAQNSGIEIYPNPVTDFLHIKGSTVSQLNLYDLQGKSIKRYDFEPKNSIEIQLTDLPAGIYAIEIISRDGAITRKRLVKN